MLLLVEVDCIIITTECELVVVLFKFTLPLLVSRWGRGADEDATEAADDGRYCNADGRDTTPFTTILVLFVLLFEEEITLSIELCSLDAGDEEEDEEGPVIVFAAPFCVGGES